MVSIGLVIGVALISGFRPTADPTASLAAIGLILLITLALTWLACRTRHFRQVTEGANGSTLLRQFGPFISSAFVDPDISRPECAGSPRTSRSHP